jgi:hypothetical protein
MIKRWLPAVVGVVLSAGVAQAGSLSVALNDFSAQVALSQPVSEDARGQSVLGVRGLYSDRGDTELVSAGLEVLGPFGKTGLELGAGVRGYYADSEGDEIAGGGLGGLIRFAPARQSKFRLSGSVYYCPKILTGMDGERLLEAEVAAAYDLAPRAAVFLSYTLIRADIVNRNERTLDDSVRGGLSLSF